MTKFVKIIRFKDLKFIPASREDPKNPGSLKKALIKKNDLVSGRIQMINWAKIPVGKTFTAHYHQDMQEIFIILNGKVEAKVDSKTAILEKGDAIVVPIGKTHQMKNITQKEVDYLAIGVSLEKSGKTVVVT